MWISGPIKNTVREPRAGHVLLTLLISVALLLLWWLLMPGVSPTLSSG